MGGMGRAALFYLFLGPSSPESSLALSADRSLMPDGAPWGGRSWSVLALVLGAESADEEEIRGISEKMCLGRSISNLPVPPYNPSVPKM